MLTLTPVGGPVVGGTVIAVGGVGFFGFDSLSSTARCEFEYRGVLTVGPVRSIDSDTELACTVPVARFAGPTSVKVAINGLHFVGAPSTLADAAAGGEAAVEAAAVEAELAAAASSSGDGDEVRGASNLPSTPQHPPNTP